MPPSAVRPGIDELDAEALKVPHIVSRERRPSRRHHARYLDVTKVDRLSGSPPLRGSPCRLAGSFLVEGKNAPRKIFGDRPSECILELAPTAAGREELEAEADLEDRDRRRPNRLGGLAVQPGDDGRFGLASHERGEDVRIENDHFFLKTAARALWPRNGGMSSSRPMPANRSRSRLPRAVVSSPSARTALRRMSRTS